MIAELRTASTTIGDLADLNMSSPALWQIALNDAARVLRSTAGACAKGPAAPPIAPAILLLVAKAIEAGLVDRQELRDVARELRIAAEKAEEALPS